MKFKPKKSRRITYDCVSDSVISTYVKCDICKDDKIPVKGNSNPTRVLSSHRARCDGTKVNRIVITCESSVTDHFIEEEDHFVETTQRDTDIIPTPIDTATKFISCKNRSWYGFQQKLHEKYLQQTMKINKRAHQENAASIQDTVELFDLVTTENLSASGINKLLKILHDMHERNDVNIPLPRNHITLRRQCSKGIISSPSDARDNKGLFDLLQHEYRLSPDVFPDHNDFVFAYSYDIKQIISEVLLNMNPLNFIKEPDSRYLSDGTRNKILEDYTTGRHFKNLSEAVKRECNNCTALCIGFTLDDTQIRSGKRTFTPVQMYVLNAIDESFQMVLVGYAPGDKLPYSAKQIQEDLYDLFPKNDRLGNLKKTGKKGVTGTLVQFYLRKFQRDYLYAVFEPILATQAHGVLLRVGRFEDPNGFEINACIHLSMITGDNLQIEFLTSTSFRSQLHKCRICMSDNCCSIDPTESIGEFRDDEEMQRIGLNCEIALKEKCTSTGPLSEETKAAFAAGKEAGIKAGYNKLIDLFKWQYDRGISGFFKSLAPDYLHTVIKGVVEDCIAWVVCCLLALKDHDTRYAHNMRYVDDRIKCFPIVQSLVVFTSKPMFRWFEGISYLFKNSWHSKDSVTTGFFANGSIEGWKLPQLLFQLSFCINKDICPFTADWSINKKNLSYKWNVGRVLVNALTSVLELHFLCRMKVLSENAIHTTLTDAITNVRAHMSLLRLLKQDLMSKEDLSKVDALYTAIKPHLLAHLPFYKSFFGADHLATDTEKSESAHKPLKIDFEHTNKQFARVYLDMLFHNRIKVHHKHMMSESKEDSDTESDSEILSGYKTVFSCGAPDQLHIIGNVVTVKSTVTCINKFRSKNTKYKQKVTYRARSSAINSILVTYETVIALARKETDVDFARCWKSFEESKICCKLAKSVRCYGDGDDVVIHCNGRHTADNGKRVTNICDFIEVKYLDDYENECTNIARLVCIFSFYESKKAKEEIYLLICWMEKKKIIKPILPYPCYGYEITRNNKSLCLQIVSIETMIRPAFLVSHSLRGSLFWSDVSQKTVPVLKDQMFYCLPYNAVVRDHCDSFVEYVGSSSNSSSSSSSSSSSLGDELPMMLSKAQQQNICRLLNMTVNESFEDEDKKEDEDEDEEECN